MNWSLIFFVPLVVACSTAFGLDSESGAYSASVENQEVLVQVARDGSYTVEERTELRAQNEVGRRALQLQKFTYDEDRQDLVILEAGVRQGGQEKLVRPEDYRHDRLDDGRIRMGIPFGELKPEAVTWTKIRRVPKVKPPAGLFNMEFVYGVLRLEKAGRVEIKSETPLYFQTHDPQGALKVESQSQGSGTRLTIVLQKPVLSVANESLRVSSQEELGREVPRVLVSNAKNWDSLAKAVWSSDAAPLQLMDLPNDLRRFVETSANTSVVATRAERVLTWMGENFSVEDRNGLFSSRSVREILAARSGSGVESARLTIHLLRLVGVEAQPVLVGAQSEKDLLRFVHLPIDSDQPMPSLTYFNRVVLRLRLGDRWQVVDPSRGLGDPSHLPYELIGRFAWPILEDTPRLAQLNEVGEDYAGADIQTQVQRARDGEFEAHSSIEFRGELANFLRLVFYREGENGLSQYLEAFASFSRHRGFSYRKIDFFDRSAKNLRVELNYRTYEPKAKLKRTLVMPPHYLPLYSRKSETVDIQFPAFPMEISETTRVAKAFAEDETKADCTVAGPKVTLRRRAENRKGSVVISDRLHLPLPKSSPLTDDDQARFGAHSHQLNLCFQSNAIVVSRPSGQNQGFNASVDVTQTYQPPQGVAMGREELNEELRRLEVHLVAHPKDTRLWRLRAELVKQMGWVIGDTYIHEHLQLAEQYLSRAIEIDPKDDESFGELGTLALLRGDTSQAYAILNRSIELSGRGPSLLMLSGLLARQTGRWDLAASYFASAAQKSDSREMKIHALYEEASVLCDHLQACDQALPLHEEILKFKPRLSGRLHKAAQAFARAGRVERAIELEREAVANSDLDIYRTELLKELLSEASRRMPEVKEPAGFAAIRALLEEAYSLEPHNPRTLGLLTELKSHGDLRSEDPPRMPTSNSNH